MDRKSAIQAAAERLMARKALPQGKWVPLENHVKVRGVTKLVGARTQSSRGLRRSSTRLWAVLVHGSALRGEKIEVSTFKGEKCIRYVHAIIKSALERSDGNALVSVGEHPPKEEEAVPAVLAPMPQGVFTSQGPRNPRICEECDGPCRPGAGMCDQCKALPVRSEKIS